MTTIMVCETCHMADGYHAESCNIQSLVEQFERAAHYPAHTAVEVSPPLPDCDICRYVDRVEKPERALYDGATASGPWANMCGPHFTQHGRGLGLGRGQRLIIGPAL